MSASDVNKLFLQAIISRQYLSDDLVHVLCERAIHAVKSVNDSIDISYSRAFFNNIFLIQINKSLEPLALEFRSMKNESDGKRVWALVNNKGDEISQMATQYSPQEIAFFRQIVEQIMLAPNESFCITSLDALRQVNNLPIKSTMTKSQAEAVLQSFVTNNWLVKSPRGRYLLSARTILELSTYLRSTYEDEVLECHSCSEIITKGVSCYTQNCKIRLHKHCYSLYRNSQCPSCATDWSADRMIKVGEEAAKDGDERSKRRRKSHVADQGEVESEEEEPEEDTSPSPKRASRKGKARASRRNVDESEEEEMQVDEDSEEDPKPTRRRR